MNLWLPSPLILDGTRSRTFMPTWISVVPTRSTISHLESMIYYHSFIYLKDKLKSTGAVMSYFSSVKIWVTAVSGDSSVFNAPELYTLKCGLTKNSTHIPSKAAPGITISDFKKIIDFLVKLQPSPHVLVVGLLLAYLTLARQSNLFLTSPNVNDCPYITYIIYM